MLKNLQNIGKFILDNLDSHSSDIVPLVASEFGISRQRAHYHLTKEIEKGTVIKIGSNRWSKYSRADTNHLEFSLKTKSGVKVKEDLIWSQYVKPIILRFPENIYKICNYAFSEILNNAIDHSKSKSIDVVVDIDNERIRIDIVDNGVGIFKKIQRALKLKSMREAILHLSKGKFTTDPSNHSGLGIFFSSRMCDKFIILSGDLYYTFLQQDWFLSQEKPNDFQKGTTVSMIISLNSQKTPKEVLDEYTDIEIGFHKTIVAVALSEDVNEPHNSRSQAKRLMMGLEKFRHVILDFKGVGSVGQAFVDEVFRVFQNEYPKITIQYINANDEVKSVIERFSPGAINLGTSNT